MAEADIRSRRPLSPHLQIYKPIPTMVMSILHRLTGLALYFGTLILVWILIAAAAGPRYYGFVMGIVDSWFGLLVLFCFSWALLQHMLGGIRHLLWDTGTLIDKHSATRLAWATLAGSAVLTILVWFVALAT